MKKINKYLLVAALAATSFMFGCSKDDKNSTTDVANGSATITGIIKFNFNLANDTGATKFIPVTTYDAAPTGIVVTAQISTQSLVLNPTGGTYPTKEYRTTVNSDGTYSLTVDANEKSVPVTITVGDFRHDQIVSKSSSPFYTTNTNHIYPGATIGNVSVVSGDAKILADYTIQ